VAAVAVHPLAARSAAPGWSGQSGLHAPVRARVRRTRPVGWMHPAPLRAGVYTVLPLVYTSGMGKRLVDIDDSVLEAAQAELGTATIKATVNEALRLAGAGRADGIRAALDVLAAASPSDRADAWR